MITKKTIVTFCILVILSLLLSSCGASHQLTDESRYQTDDFRYNNLKSNELVIGGISSLNVEISREDRIQYSSMLSNLVLEQLKDVHTIRLVNTMQMVNKVGKQNYFETNCPAPSTQHLAVWTRRGAHSLFVALVPHLLHTPG